MQILPGLTQVYTSPRQLLLEAGRYRIRTAATYSDLEAVLRLRSEVFGLDFRGHAEAGLWDVDPVRDWNAIHLLLEEVSSGRVLGTYRVLQGERAQDFYTATEFSIAPFLARPGRKLELSRACTHPDARGGSAMILLWRGLGKLIQETQADWLFGCSSVASQDPVYVSAVMHQLAPAMDFRLGVTPLPGCRLEGLAGQYTPAEAASALPPLLPPLLATYLKIGARVAPLPAHDPEFQCVDFFTALELSRLDTAARRFLC